MINLQNICGLPIDFDDVECRMSMDKNLCCRNAKKVSINSLHPTLINKSVCYPLTVYEEYTVNYPEDTEIFGNNISFDIVVIPPGLLGIEFVKSHIFHVPLKNPFKPKFSSVVEGVKGITTVIMQKIGYETIDGKIQPYVKEGIIIELNPKDKIAITEGYYYTFVNTSEETSIFSRVYKNYGNIDYDKEFSRLNGLAYLCIRKNAKQEVVFNPKYRNIPNIRFGKPEENHFPSFDLDSEESLYNLVRAKTEIFQELLVD
jgi:oxalate decarboxylase/phosphoglucose isomerase-like protein (cupin superfamily)